MTPRMQSAWHKLLDSSALRGVLLVGLLIVLAAVLARTFWMLFDGPQDQITLSAQMALLDGPGASAKSASLDADEVASWALFGQTKTQGQAAAEAQENAPETHLSLKLLAVFSHAKSASAGAVISANGKPGKLYHPGDSLPGNASLYKVYPDKVLIKRLGHTEALSFEEPHLNGSVAVSKAAASERATAATGFRQQRSMVISQLALQPATAGAAQGYKVTSKIRQDVQAAVGLKPGDVITSVNGLPVGTPAADKAAMKSFYDSGKAKVSIKRGSSQITLTYPP